LCLSEYGNDNVQTPTDCPRVGPEAAPTLSMPQWGSAPLAKPDKWMAPHLMPDLQMTGGSPLAEYLPMRPSRRRRRGCDHERSSGQAVLGRSRRRGRRIAGMPTGNAD